jgi:hypothetical protein
MPFLPLDRCPSTTAHRRRVRAALCLALSIMGSLWIGDWSPVFGQTAANEANLKIARLYATAKFITWPDEAPGVTTPFVIAVIEPDPFRSGLDKLAERKLKERPIQIVRIKAVSDYRPCHLLFIPEAAPTALVNELTAQVTNQPVLVWREVSSNPPLSGTACTFLRDGDNLLIEADPAELKRRKLTPDGRLLSLNLVRVVKTGKTP